MPNNNGTTENVAEYSSKLRLSTILCKQLGWRVNTKFCCERILTYYLQFSLDTYFWNFFTIEMDVKSIKIQINSTQIKSNNGLLQQKMNYN